MADIISRLKLESGEFDSKIKRAGQELMAYSEHCKKMGLEMGYANNDAKEFAKALGSMQTTSSSARGKINELTEAFVNLKVMYKNMTDEEKNNTFGKNLAASLDQLKTRIDQAKAELNDVNKELGNTKQAEVDTKGGLEGLTNALGVNVKTLVGWGTAIAAGKAALDMAKDAFFASETSLDEWGRTVQSTQSLYQGFLSALNNSDVSGFLSRMDEIVSAARDAYNAMDELGTFSAFQQRNVAKGRAGYAQALDEYRLNPTADNKQKLQQANQKVMNDLRESHDKTEAAYQAALRQIATERISGKGMQDAFVKMFSEGNYGDLQAAKASYKTGRGLNFGAQYYYGDRVYDGRVQDRATGKWRDMSATEKQQFEFARALSQVNDSQIKEVQALGAQSVAITEQIYQQDRAYNRLSGNNTPLRGNGKGGKTDIQFADDSIMAQEKLVSDLTQKWKTASGELRDGYLKDLEEAQQKLAEMTNKAKGPDLDKLFPDMSKQNFNTGYAGSAQAKYDSARADLALGPMNLDAVNDYIGSVKGMLKDANLGDELYNNMTKKLKDATTVSTLLQEMMERGLAGADLETTAQALKEKLLSPEGIDQTAIQSFLDTLNAQIEEAGGVGLKLNSKTGEVSDKDKDKDERDGNRFMKKNDEGKYEAKMTDIMSGMAGGINNVVSGLNTLGVEIPAGLQSVLGGMQAITSILSGIAVTAMAIEAIAGADAIIPFANGGLIGRAAGGMMIPGNFMSGDRLRLPVDGGRGMIGVNSGELILNRAQQGIIASELEGGGMQNLHLDTVIGAEDIRVVLNNRGRRTGRGEYVQSRKYNG